MAPTELMSEPPPALLRAAALLRRAGATAGKLEADLCAAVRDLERAQVSLHADAQVHAAQLLAAVRVRLLDARTCTDRLPMLAQEAEALAEKASRQGAPTAQEGGAP